MTLLNDIRGKREPVLDLGKGIAVVLMVQVHLLEVFVLPDVLKRPIGAVLLFLGGPLVAPVFLGIFGFLMAQKRYAWSALLRRGGQLLILGCLLNVGMNGHLLVLVHTGRLDVNPLEYLLGVDILLSAGLSVLALLALRTIFRGRAMPYLMAAGVIVLMAPAVSRICTVDSTAKYVLAFVGGDYGWSYFPLFTWLAYPLVGYAVGVSPRHWYAEAKLPRRFTVLGWMFGVLLLAFFGIFVTASLVDLPQYYHHGYQAFLWIALLLMLWMRFLRVVDGTCGQSSVCQYLKWLGRHVTTAYVIQWLLIGNIGTALYRTQTLAELLMWFVVIMTVMSGLVLLLSHAREALR